MAQIGFALGSQKPTAYNYALNLLAARPYTTRSLHRKLIQREYEAADAEEAIRRLVGNGLLDDVRYAEQYARSKMLTVGSSKRRLQQDLFRKGIPPAVANAAVESVVEQEGIDLPGMIERVARKKLSQLGDLEPLILRRRLYAFLARRGYELEEIKGVVSRLIPR